MSSARARADWPLNSGLPSSAPSTTKRTWPECVASPALIARSIWLSTSRGKTRRTRQWCSTRCLPMRLMPMILAYQLPDAPPPPKLPPPPENPLSLEPELDPPDHEPPEEPLDHPPPPPPPPRRLASWLAAKMLSPNIVRKKAMTPKMPETAIEPRRNQTMALTT